MSECIFNAIIIFLKLLKCISNSHLLANYYTNAYACVFTDKEIKSL